MGGLLLSPWVLRAGCVATLFGTELRLQVMKLYLKGIPACRTCAFWLLTFPIAIVCAAMVFFYVFGSGNNYEVIYSVVGFYSILMVDKFCFQKRAAQRFAHYHSVFGDIADISGFQRVWMLWPQKVNITILGNKPTASPARVICPAMSVSGQVAANTLGHSPEGRSAWRKAFATTAFAIHRKPDLMSNITMLRQVK